MTEERILDKIGKLLERANHPNTPVAERETCLATADKMMEKYAVDQATLEASMTREERRRPVKVAVPNAVPNSHWSYRFRLMLTELARTNRCQFVQRFFYDNEEDVLIGMQEDVSYVEMVWQSIMFDFLRQLDPGWSEHGTYDANVYSQVRAGTKWRHIAELATVNGHDTPWPDGGRLKRAYNRECKRRGEEPTAHTQRNAAYRESFAEHYVRRVCLRLEEQREAANGAASGSGAELVLSDRQDDIRDMLAQMAGYDDMDAYRKARDERNEERRRQEAEDRAAHERWLAGLSATERARHERQLAQAEAKQARENDRYWRQHEREQERNYDSRGAANGRSAGDKVSLDRSKEAPGARTGIEA